MRLKMNQDTKLLFQIGDPLDHATAAYVHNSMYEMGYVNAVNLFSVIKKGDLGPFIDACKLIGAIGFDITTPHKSDIIPFLDICDDFARDFNCVNHVRIRDGKLEGICLDGVGMALAMEAHGANFKGATVLMLGAGAVCGPIAAEICKGGAARIIILNRTVSKADAVAASLKKYFADIEVLTDSLNAETMHQYAKGTDMVVQCTSLGLAGSTDDFSDEEVAFVNELPKHAMLADVIYNPVTKIQKAAMAAGLQAIGGVLMVVYQEKALMKFHFDVDLPDSFATEAEESLLTALAMCQFRLKRLHGEDHG